MSVRVRLTRVGSKKNPMWRVVVADQRSPRDGRIIESIGHYNPQTHPSTIVIDRERLQHWIDLGAQPTNTVAKLMRAPDTLAEAVVTEKAVAVVEPAAPAEPAPAADETAADAPEDEGEAGTVPVPEATDDAEPPAEGETAPDGTAGSESEAGPSGVAVEPSEDEPSADDSPADDSPAQDQPPADAEPDAGSS